MQRYHPPIEKQLITLTIHPPPLGEAFLEGIKIEAGWVDRIDVAEVNGGYIVRIVNDPVNGSARLLTPHCSVHNSGEIRFWDTERPLNEFGYFYVAVYIAGNYARYYPDRWLLDVENSTPLAIAIEELCEIVQRRVPWLTLCELSRTLFVLS